MLISSDIEKNRYITNTTSQDVEYIITFKTI